MNLWGLLDKNLLMTLAAFVTALLVMLIKDGWGYVKAHTKNQTLLAVEEEIQRAMTTEVLAASQTVVADLKAQNGGKLSESDAVKIKNDVLAKVEAKLTPDAIDIINTLKGGLANYLPSVLEATVFQTKLAK